MKKSIVVILFAGLLLLSATACAPINGPASDTDPSDTSYNPFPGTQVSVPTTPADPGTSAYVEPATDAPDNTSEPNAKFTDINKKVVVITAVATVRSDTVLASNNGVGWPKEGTEFTVTGESANWYRLTYAGKTAYISKSVVCDASLLEGFTSVNDTVEVSDNVNVRSVPSTASADSIRGILTKGTKVARIGVSDKWSIILFEVVSETETDITGQRVKEMKHYYVSNDCLVDPSAATKAP